jgi:hypothetical protein
MNLQCPKCQSENTQKLSLAVEGGTFNTSGKTLGVGVGGAGVGAFGGASKGKSVSKTAEKYAEPEKLPAILGPLGIMLLAGLVSIFVGGSAITVGLWLAGVTMVLSFIHNFFVFPKEHAAWDAKYICQRCAHVFELGGDEADEEADHA